MSRKGSKQVSDESVEECGRMRKKGEVKERKRGEKNKLKGLEE